MTKSTNVYFTKNTVSKVAFYLSFYPVSFDLRNSLGKRSRQFLLSPGRLCAPSHKKVKAGEKGLQTSNTRLKAASKKPFVKHATSIRDPVLHHEHHTHRSMKKRLIHKNPLQLRLYHSADMSCEHYIYFGSSWGSIYY